MKFKIIELLIVFLIIATKSLTAQEINSYTDTRDSKKYKTVVIGKQTWMSENLNFESENSWNYQNQSINGNKFGRLYTWDAANKSCPAGWHLPSDLEWKELEKFLGMPENDLDKFDKWRGTDQGAQLISDTSLNFNILMGGYRNPPSNYNLLDLQAFFWTSSVEYDLAWFRQLYNKNVQIFRRTRPKSWAFSVRCVKDL